MCGDLEGESQLHGDLYARFVARAQALLQRPPGPGDLNHYLDTLFHDLLERCHDDNEQVASPSAYAQMAMQSLVLARLAGFVAGHVALNEDPMRKLLEAVMLGYGEAEHARARSDHGHDHAH